MNTISQTQKKFKSADEKCEKTAWQKHLPISKHFDSVRRDGFATQTNDFNTEIGGQKHPHR